MGETPTWTVKGFFPHQHVDYLNQIALIEEIGDLIEVRPKQDDERVKILINSLVARGFITLVSTPEGFSTQHKYGENQ